MNIYQKINAVQKNVAYVKKDAQIMGGGSYKAVTHDQVVSVLRKDMVANGIVVVPEQLKGEIIKEPKTKNGSVMYFYSGDYAIHFVNAEEAEDRISVTVNAHALDSQDKAPGKALTYATKAALLKENEESRTAASEPYSPMQKEQFDEIVASNNALDYLQFMHSLTEEGRIGLFNSGEAGKKVELKKQCKSLEEEAHNIIDDYVSQINECYNSDDSSVMELVDELTNFEKSLIANKLDKNAIDWLAAKTKEIQ